jgi:hypothetical protein
VTLRWSVPAGASHDAVGWHYRYLVQRQAGLAWQVNLRLTLPSCATIVGQPQGLSATSPQAASVSRANTQDTTFAVDYTCATSSTA